MVDLLLKQDTEAVKEIELKEPGEYNLKDYGTNPIIKEIVIPDEQIEYWGNILTLIPNQIQLTVVYLDTYLKVNLPDHHHFMLQTVNESIKSKEQIIVKLNAQIDKLLKENELVLDAACYHSRSWKRRGSINTCRNRE